MLIECRANLVHNLCNNTLILVTKTQKHSKLDHPIHKASNMVDMKEMTEMKTTGTQRGRITTKLAKMITTLPFNKINVTTLVNQKFNTPKVNYRWKICTILKWPMICSTMNQEEEAHVANNENKEAAI